VTLDWSEHPKAREEYLNALVKCASTDDGDLDGVRLGTLRTYLEAVGAQLSVSSVVRDARICIA